MEIAVRLVLHFFLPRTMSENNKLPALQSSEDKLREEVENFLLDPREDYPEPYYMLEYNGVPLEAYKP